MTDTCGHCRNPIDRPAYLCDACVRHVTERLGRMRPLYAALSAWLAPGARRGQQGRAGRSDAPLPVRTDVLCLRGPGGIVGLLEDWRSAMQAARGWSEPAVYGSIEDRITRAARGLNINLDWIAAEWDAAPDLAAELARLERQVLAVIEPPEPTVRLGPCPTPGDDGPCGATLRVPAGTADIHCRHCGTTYPPGTWQALAGAMAA